MATLLSDDEVFTAQPSSLLSDADIFGEPEKKEGAFARAGRIAADPEGGLLPAAGSLIASAMPEGGGKRGATGVGKDTGVDLASGVVGLGESVIGLGNLVTFGQLGKGMEALGYDPKSTNEFLTGLYTEDRKAAEQNVAGAEGFLGTLSALAVNPSALFGRVVQSIPSTVAGGAAAGALARRLLPGAAEAAGKAGLVGDEAAQFIANYVGRRAAVAAGTAEGAMSAGSIAEQGRQAGREFTDYALPALGGGAVTGLIGAGSGAVSRKLGVGDIETDIAMRGAGQPITQAAGGIVGRVLKEAGKEGILEEAPQSFNEAVAGNLAQGKPWDENVGKQTAEGLAAGAAMGGAHAGLRGSPPRKPVEQQAEEIAQAPDVDSAIAAANELAGANEDLGAAIGDYVGVPVTTAPNQNPDFESVAPEQQSDALDQPIAGAVAPTQQVGVTEATRQGIDRNAELTAQANAAGTSFEREQALAQRAVAQEQATGTPERSTAADFADLTAMDPKQAKQRLVVMRDQAERAGEQPMSLVIAKHPSVAGKVAIRRLPSVTVAEKQQPEGPSVASAQQSIEAAAAAAPAQKTDEGRQALISSIMSRIESRNGVAAPEEAQALEQMGLGQPYDRVDQGLAAPLSEDEKLTAATGIQVNRAPRETVVPGAPAARAAEVQAQTIAANQARERANQEGMQRQEARAANATQAREAMRDTMAEATAPKPAARPPVAEVESALALEPFKRSVAQRAAVKRATETYTADEMAALQAKPFERTTEQRLTIKRLRDEVKRSASRADDDVLAAESTGDEKLTPVRRDTLPRATAAGRQAGITREVADTLDKVASIFGKRVVYFSSSVKAGSDGFVSSDSPDAVYINIQSGKPHLVVLGHEITHLLKRDSPAAYAALEAAIKAHLSETADADHARDYGPGADLEELVADLVGNRFQEESFWTAVFDKMTDQVGQDKAVGFIAKLGAAVSRATNAVKKVVANTRGFKADEFVTDVDAVRDAVQSAIRQYAADRKISAAQMAAEGMRKTPVAEGAETASTTRGDQPRDDAGRFTEYDELDEVQAQIERQDASRKSASRDDDVPSYGVSQDGAISVRGVHYSKQPRTILNSGLAGTGLRGADNQRIADEGGIKDRIYFYVEKGRGVIPESGVGGYAHEVQLNNLYDADADPDLLAEDNPSPTKFEQAVVDAGFDGYYRDSFRTDVGAAVLLGEHAVPVKQTSRGPAKPTGRVPQRAAVPERTGWRKVVADLKAARSLPSGELTPDRWSRVLKATMPSVHAALEQAGVFTGTTPLYKDGLIREFSAGQVKRSSKRQDYVESLLLPDERAKLRRDTARTLVQLFDELPSGNEMAAVAFAGRAKRGWYENSAKAMVSAFGADAPRFAALLAALSPQTSVENNLTNALTTWKNWVLEDRPTDQPSIRRILGKSVMGNKGMGSVLHAWVPNSVRALASPDIESVILSGPKVNSFMLNLRGKVDEVTNDAWMANYALINQTLFAGKLTKTDPGKGTGYLAMSARVREAARALTKLTGDTWTPAEVQETVWSWAKTLYEKQASANEDRGARMLVMDKAITDEMIASTPDFRTLFNEDGNARTLRDAGLDAPASDGAAGARKPRAAGETAPFAADAQERYELQGARRLERLYTEGAAAFASRDELTGVRRSTARPATLADFKNDLADALQRPGWTVLTATQEARDARYNASANKRLERELKERGLAFEPVRGMYKGVDQGINYLVEADRKTAIELGAKYKQESVLTNRGLEYMDGSLVPAVPSDTKVGKPAKKEDFFSVLPDGQAFSMGLDFVAKTEPATIVVKTQHSPDEPLTIDLDGRSLTVASPRDAVRRLDAKIDKYQELIKCLRS